MFKYKYILLLVIVLPGLVAGCGDWLTGDKLDNDPNIASTVTIGQIFNGVQGNIFIQLEGHLARTAAMWMQQMSGTDRQYSSHGVYDVSDQDYNTYFASFYDGGGLIDLRRGQDMAAEQGDRLYAGIFKVLEGMYMGYCASSWGDIPYSEAASDVDKPKLDAQSAVYAALQAKLDDGISDLSAGGKGPGAADLVFGGDAAKWIAAAHSIKARLYMHWAKVDNSNLSLALAQANQGISSSAGDVKTLHEASQQFANTWYQYYIQRDSYMRAGKFFVDLLKDRNDPRVATYFEDLGGGTYLGADPGTDDQATSYLNFDTYGALDWSTPLITYEETQFIIAECVLKGNSDDAAARAAANAAIDNIWATWGYTEPKPDLSALSGNALFEEIMIQKYIALFTNIEVWNDWKRTGIPALTPFYLGNEGSGQIPRRFLYGSGERIANPNIPSPGEYTIFKRNENDPDKAY